MIRSTRAVLLVEQEGGARLLIDLTDVVVQLTSFLNEYPPVHDGPLLYMPPSTFDHYGVEMTGESRRVVAWDGTGDPFARAAIERPNQLEGP